MRVWRLRAILQVTSSDSCIKAHLDQVGQAFAVFASIAERVGARLFRLPHGTYWDMPVMFKAVPKVNTPEPTGGREYSLDALRNFSYCAYQWAAQLEISADKGGSADIGLVGGGGLVCRRTLVLLLFLVSVLAPSLAHALALADVLVPAPLAACPLLAYSLPA